MTGRASPILLLVLAVLPACGGEKRDGGSAAGGSGGFPADLGAAQIGIGVPHDPAWLTALGGPGEDEALAVSATGAGVYVGGSTASSWFRPLADTCDPAINPEHAGEDC